MLKILFISIAGALGAVSRYGLSSLVHRVMGKNFAWGTLTVNVAGCLIIGFLFDWMLNADTISPSLRLALTVGFLGAFTTFSAFSYETLEFANRGMWGMAGLNVAANVVLGVFAVVLGLGIGKAVFS